jgi:Diadenosine tetraphosphate (Ap4A) hydrolase and other HIT family hydrolases
MQPTGPTETIPCTFCDIVRGTAPATRVYEDDSVLSFLPLPEGRIADGHLLVIPKRHVSDVFDVSAADLQALALAVQRVSEALRKALQASGVNILNASGPNSDQSVFHLHFHVVPRWKGDGLHTWPEGRSAHRVSGDSTALIRNQLARDIARR